MEGAFQGEKEAVVPGEGQPALVLMIWYSDKRVRDVWVESSTQLGTGGWGSSTEVQEHRTTSEPWVEPGSCHFVWALGSCCLFPGSPGTEGKLLSLIPYFGIHSFPLGVLHFLFLECFSNVFTDLMSQRDFQLGELLR